MENTRRRDTGPELRLRSLLHDLGLRYRVDISPIAGMRSRADLVFTRARVAVFVNGCFWHGCPKHGTWPKANAEWWRLKIESNRARDARVDAALRAAGWEVVRVWEHDALDKVVHRIAASVRQRSFVFRGLRRKASPSDIAKARRLRR